MVYVTKKSRQAYLSGKEYLADGVASSFHKAAVEEYPLVMARGKGSKLIDIDGNEYIDYVAGFGPMLLGYNAEKVNEAIREQLKRGAHFGAPTEQLYELAQKLVKIIPCAERISFQSSGTEANMHAFRLVRAYTGKKKIIKFEGQYHGWSDEQKISISAKDISELDEDPKKTRIMDTAGQRKAAADDIIIAPWNDLEYVERILQNNHDVAAIITEPVMLDSGPILPKKNYLAGLRKLSREYGCLLVFDEVITGFRLALGGAQEYYQVIPDLAVFGKAVAGGFSLSLVAGKKEIMELGHPSGTFNATPIAVAAAVATLTEIQNDGFYRDLEKMSQRLAQGIMDLAGKHHISAFSTGLGGVCLLNMGIHHSPEDFRDHLRNADQKKYNDLVFRLKLNGVRFTPERGREYVSSAHTTQDIDATLSQIENVFSAWAKN